MTKYDSLFEDNDDDDGDDGDDDGDDEGEDEDRDNDDGSEIYHPNGSDPARRVKEAMTLMEELLDAMDELIDELGGEARFEM